ncbi:MAG: DUF2203 domain-containing protein [Chloroflexi bacterium]|nr:DUF2203 domain-containing protein [Chloroflexota bacterium]
MARYFTLEEATALLPQLREILQEIISLRARLDRTERELVDLHWKARTNGHVNYEGSFGEGQSERTALRQSIQAEMLKIFELGVELKDPALGLVDFPSLREGQVVLLCWRLGEPAIGYWHDRESGFGGRQPL